MHVQSASLAASRGTLGCAIVPHGHAVTARMPLTVESVGYLVPAIDPTGWVHSTFERACNIACNGTLLTLCTSSAADGPTTLRLAHGPARDLRDLFDIGEVVRRRDGGMQTSRVELELTHASVWRPLPRARLLSSRCIDAHVRHALGRLAQCRSTHASVIDGEGASVVFAMRDACRALDSEQAVRHAARLVGWGEGLTPAGDDFLLGLIAGLNALVGDSERRGAFHRLLAAALNALTPRTTAIAAHYLRLAAGGHHTEPLVRLRHALLCEDDLGAVDAALCAALAVGATSGADTVSGLLAGLLAWLPASTTCEVP